MKDAVHRPLVVLAGWLGCQPRSLRRYEELYKQAGFRVMSRIATPSMVVNSVFSFPPLSVPPTWPNKMDEPKTIQGLAWDILAEANSTLCPFVFFHVLSNGGCFVWEQIRRLLSLTQDNEKGVPEPVRRALTDLRKRSAGVVFDSCPGVELHRINEAMEYCTWKERLDAMLHGGVDYLFLNRPAVQQKIRERADLYIHNLRDDSWDLPQLYLYSQDDHLAPYKAIDDLVEDRKRLFGRNRIWSRKFASSKHCAHLLKHPEEYKMAVDSFVDSCIQRAVRSKL